MPEEHHHHDHEHHHNHEHEAEELPPNYLDSGWLEVCLDVKDLQKSIEFYEKLGFVHVGGEMEDGWAVMENDLCRISLYKGHLPGNVLNFRGGDVQAIGDTLKERGLKLKTEVTMEEDGSLGLTLLDPDGNEIYFNTHPDELKECDCDCEGCDCESGTCDCDDEEHRKKYHGDEPSLRGTK